MLDSGEVGDGDGDGGSQHETPRIGPGGLFELLLKLWDVEESGISLAM